MDTDFCLIRLLVIRAHDPNGFFAFNHRIKFIERNNLAENGIFDPN